MTDIRKQACKVISNFNNVYLFIYFNLLNNDSSFVFDNFGLKYRNMYRLLVIKKIELLFIFVWYDVFWLSAGFNCNDFFIISHKSDVKEFDEEFSVKCQ